MTTFLPKGYEALKIEKSYWKMSQMQQGDNRMRIMSQPIAGWIDWQEKKPLRFKPENKPTSSIDPKKPLKGFWACYVWDYAREALFILEITQSSLLRALTLLGKDEDWGDFTKYDIKLNKQGQGETTKYTLTPLPHKPITAKMHEALERSPVRLEALFEGGDPWTDLYGDDTDLDTGEASGLSAVGNPLETLREHLVVDQLNSERLEEYLTWLADDKDQTVEQVVESALLPQLLSRFKSSYSKYLAKNPKPQPQSSAA